MNRVGKLLEDSSRVIVCGDSSVGSPSVVLSYRARNLSQAATQGLLHSVLLFLRMAKSVSSLIN